MYKLHDHIFKNLDNRRKTNDVLLKLEKNEALVQN